MAESVPTHILYHYPFSSCSMMARYAFALRGKVKDKDHEIRIYEKLINIGPKQEHLTEHFLCDVNPNGEVPVLEWSNTGKKLPDSVAITHYFAESYPSLIPLELENEIKDSLRELHSISFFALSFTGQPQALEANIKFLQEQLQQNISDRYRKAIENKIQRSRTSHLDQLEPENVATAVSRTEGLMARIEQHLNKSESGWIFNTESPTAFDAHFIVFVVRMLDVKRENLIPERIRRYVDTAISQKPWENVMEGRRTMPNL